MIIDTLKYLVCMNLWVLYSGKLVFLRGVMGEISPKPVLQGYKYILYNLLHFYNNHDFRFLNFDRVFPPKAGWPVLPNRFPRCSEGGRGCADLCTHLSACMIELFTIICLLILWIENLVAFKNGTKSLMWIKDL